MSEPKTWKLDGVRVVHANELDINTAQTPGMNRAAAIAHARMGSKARMRWGEKPEEVHWVDNIHPHPHK
jgi:uncharacterized RmlC-like cupin family protein